MATEIERKFLVNKALWKPIVKGITIAQGYLQHDKDKVVRVRIKGTQGFLTIKGKNNGISRLEFEYEIPITDAEELLVLCDKGVIYKTRYEIPYKGFIWEVDEFKGENEGLFLAEVELKSADEDPEIPLWVRDEVSRDPRYFNSFISEHPFSKWRNDQNNIQS
jgi:adenylate cyclase